MEAVALCAQEESALVVSMIYRLYTQQLPKKQMDGIHLTFSQGDTQSYSGDVSMVIHG